MDNRISLASAPQDPTLHDRMLALGRAARLAARVVALAPDAARVAALHAAARRLRAAGAAILAANAGDVAAGRAQKMTPSFLDRLTLAQ